MSAAGQPDDLDLVTRAILAEAGNQGPVGQAAVAAVIRNRVQKRKMSPGDVVLEHNQFEPFNASNVGGRNDPMRFDPQSPEYQRARQIAQGVFSGEFPDFSDGATHFANVSTVQQRNGGGIGNHGWINPKNQTARIGAHTFFAPEGRVQGYNTEMTLPTALTQDTGALAPIGGVGGGGAPNASMSTPVQMGQSGQQQNGMFSSMFQPPGAGTQTPRPSGGAMGGQQATPPILGRLLFGDQGLNGFLKNAIPTPMGGQGLVGGMVNGLKGAGGGAPMALPSAGAGMGMSAAPAMAQSAAPAAAAGAGGAGIGSFLSSLFAML